MTTLMALAEISPLPQARGGEDDLETARRVLETEAAALQALSTHIGPVFSEAVHALAATKARKGRVIVTGMGKSGQIGCKIASTLASTGTPAFFVHPGEASHGDLGMVTGEDCVLALSNSGEAPELSDFVAFTRRFGIPLIGVTSGPDSSLAKHSDITLLIPKYEEACPNGLAPTTSTTMMLALGDALAIALLERMNLKAEQYKVFHPGGKLGRRLVGVRDVMIPAEDLPVCVPGTTMDQALLVMSGKNLGSILIAEEDGTLRGIITDGDLKRHMGPDILQLRVEEIMNPEPKTVSGGILAAEAVDIMVNRFQQPITALVVLDPQGGLEGLIRMQDCLRVGVA